MPPFQAKTVVPAAALIYLIARRKDLPSLSSLFTPNGGRTRKMLAGIAIIFGFERAVARALARAGLKLPSSLISMITAFILLKALEKARGKEESDRVANFFAPAVEHLGKWMPLYLTPPLVVLPDALSAVSSDDCPGGAATMWAKLGGIHAAGWLFSLVTTAAVARHLQERSAAKAAAAAAAAGSGKSNGCRHCNCEANTAKAGGGDAAAAAGNEASEADGDEAAAAAAAPEASLTAVDTADAGASNAADNGTSAATEPAANPKPAGPTAAEKAAKMRRAWAVLTAAALVLSPRVGEKPATLAATVLALLLGNSLPANAKRVLHPLVVCSVGTGLFAAALGAANGRAPGDSLRAYFSKAGMLRGGAGDLFFGLLGSSCCALGFRMFYNRDSLQRNLGPLLGSTCFSSLLSLFGTTAVAGVAGLPPMLSLTLAQRSVMSSLGIPAAQLLGGDAALAVASILVTGVYGASIGQAVLDAIGCCHDAPVPRGIATGASAHSIGTASLMESEPEAAAISSVSLCLAGIIHTVVCSVPAAQKVLKRLAGATLH